MLLVNYKSSNKELLAIPEIAEIVEAGHLVLIDKVPTANPDYFSLYFFGYVDVASSTTNKVQQILLEWTDNSKFPMRAMQNAVARVSDKFEIGKSFPEFAIQVIDTNTPAYDKHTPRQSKTGEIYVDEFNKPIYRTGRLVTKDELIAEGHKTIKRVTAKMPANSAAVSAMFSV